MLAAVVVVATVMETGSPAAWGFPRGDASVRVPAATLSTMLASTWSWACETEGSTETPPVIVWSSVTTRSSFVVRLPPEPTTARLSAAAGTSVQCRRVSAPRSPGCTVIAGMPAERRSKTNPLTKRAALGGF